MVLESVYIPSDIDRFPEYDCVKSDDSDSRIFYGTRMYEVLVIDLDDPGHYEIIRGVRPYICDEGSDVRYGWLCEDDSYIDNLYKSIHGDKRCVIGYLVWTEPEYCKQMWNQYKSEYNKNWSN